MRYGENYGLGWGTAAAIPGIGADSTVMPSEADLAQGLANVEAATPPRVWSPGLMIAALALLAAWWLRKH